MPHLDDGLYLFSRRLWLIEEEKQAMSTSFVFDGKGLLQEYDVRAQS